MARQKFIPLPTLPPESIDNLMRQITMGGQDECWLWTGNLNKGGYGTFGFHGRTYIITRMVYLIANGEDPGSLRVCHTCDNPPCCNPYHLVLGDQTTNMRGACERNRIARGERASNFKLVTDQVLEIRKRHADGEKYADIAQAFGVSYPTVFYIVKRRYWPHV